MRVALDATSLLGPRTGVGTFTSELLARLARRPELDLRAFGVTWRGRQGLGAVVPPGVRVVGRPMAARPLREAWMRGDHPTVEWWTGAVDVVHGPNFVVPPARRAGEVVTVHDLTCVRFPELCTADTLQYPALLRRALARGAWVHTVSSFVADEVVDHFGADPARVVPIPNGAPDPVDPAQLASRAGRGRVVAGGDRYVLALGTLEPRKDLPTLVAAFDRLAADDGELRLVLAGPDGWGADAVTAAADRAAHRDRVVRTGWVSGPDRDALLAGAAAFAFPSRYEGFGLPPLEAAAAGVPVVATRAGALPEVLGDAAEWCDVGDVDGLAAALLAVLADEDRRRDLVAAGHGRLARFTWDRCATGVAELYERVQGDRRRSA